MQVWLAGELIVRAERQGLGLHSPLPPQLFHKTTVRILILTGNELDSLPPRLFQQLRELRELRLGHNRLTQLPHEVALLQHLETLDLSHNQLEEVPAALCRCAHLQRLDLDGNPLCASLRALWQEPAPAAAVAGCGGSGTQADSSSSTAAPGGGGTGAGLGSKQRLRSNTRAVLGYLLQQQDPGTVQQVQQTRLAVLQEASRARLAKQLRNADSDSLLACQRLATEAQLGPEVLGQVQHMQEAAEALQAAVDAVQQQKQGGAGADAGVPADLQAQLKAAHARVQELCKPGRPTGALHASAISLMQQLQRQQLERGWRCADSQPAAGASAVGPAAAPEAAPAASPAEGTATPGARRFLTSAERTRQKLASHGARTHQEWAALKQQQQDKQKQMLKDLANAEVQGRVKAAADMAARAVDNCERERQWPSKRSGAYPPGTFRLDPDVLRAVRRAYHKAPPLAPAAAFAEHAT